MKSIYRLVETLQETNALLRELSNRLDPSYSRNAHFQTRTYADAVEFHKFATGKPFDHEKAARWSQGEYQHSVPTSDGGYDVYHLPRSSEP